MRRLRLTLIIVVPSILCFYSGLYVGQLQGMFSAKAAESQGALDRVALYADNKLNTDALTHDQRIIDTSITYFGTQLTGLSLIMSVPSPWWDNETPLVMMNGAIQYRLDNPKRSSGTLRNVTDQSIDKQLVTMGEASDEALDDAAIESMRATLQQWKEYEEAFEAALAYGRAQRIGD
ncbi:MAG: hypothetical protein AAF525_18010 [Pseudomonadota bacterium]